MHLLKGGVSDSGERLPNKYCPPLSLTPVFHRSAWQQVAFLWGNTTECRLSLPDAAGRHKGGGGGQCYTGVALADWLEERWAALKADLCFCTESLVLSGCPLSSSRFWECQHGEDGGETDWRSSKRCTLVWLCPLRLANHWYWHPAATPSRLPSKLKLSDLCFVCTLCCEIKRV